MVDYFWFILNIIQYLASFLVLMIAIVIVHEMGHFLAGRMFGVKVDVFSFGFGPRIFHFFDKKGVEWVFALVPLGGYVKFRGDQNAASMPDDNFMKSAKDCDINGSFHSKPVWQRAIIAAAGPFANFLLAFMLFTGGYLFVGETMLRPVIGEVSKSSPAEKAGFLAGDKILTIDGTKIESFMDLSRLISSREEDSLAFTIDRDGKELILVGTPIITKNKSKLGTDRRAMMGFIASSDPKDVFVKHYGFFSSAYYAYKEIEYIIKGTGSYISGVFAGRESVDQISGPVRIAYVSGKVAEMGFFPFISIIAVFSVSVGMINLLPIPMLDGGHLFFYLIEAINGRPINQKAQAFIFKVGFAFLLFIMIFSTGNDFFNLMDYSF